MTINKRQVTLLSLSILLAAVAVPAQVRAKSNTPWYSSKAVWACGAAAFAVTSYLFKKWYTEKPYVTKTIWEVNSTKDSQKNYYTPIIITTLSRSGRTLSVSSGNREVRDDFTNETHEETKYL